jgi:hypothetical protein
MGKEIKETGKEKKTEMMSININDLQICAYQQAQPTACLY